VDGEQIFVVTFWIIPTDCTLVCTVKLSQCTQTGLSSGKSQPSEVNLTLSDPWLALKFMGTDRKQSAAMQACREWGRGTLSVTSHTPWICLMHCMTP